MRYASGGRGVTPGDAYGRADVGQVWNKNGKRSHQHGHGGSGASGDRTGHAGR